jgi:hypothetical protein
VARLYVRSLAASQSLQRRTVAVPAFCTPGLFTRGERVVLNRARRHKKQDFGA